MRLIVLLVVSTVLSGCGANIDDLVVFTEQVRANTQVNIEEYPEFESLPSAEYAATDYRNPFVKERSVKAVDVIVETPNCVQPNKNRKTQALENYGLDALTMAGVFTSNGKKFALIKANDGSLHKIGIGSYIGLFNGKVTSINEAGIVISEMLPDGAGCWKSKNATLTMTSMVGENNDV